MTKLHKIAIAFLLATVMGLSGCAEQEPIPASGADANSSSDSNFSNSTATSNGDSSSTDPVSAASSYDPENSSDSGSEPDLQTLIENFPVEIINFPDGSSLSKYEATSASDKDETYFL